MVWPRPWPIRWRPRFAVPEARGHNKLICAVTIIGIPFGYQHLKLAVLALAPVGMTIVSIEEADTARLYVAQAAVARMRAS